MYYNLESFVNIRLENALDALKRSVARVVIDPLKNSKPNLYAIIPPIYMALENNIDR